MERIFQVRRTKGNPDHLPGLDTGDVKSFEVIHEEYPVKIHENWGYKTSKQGESLEGKIAGLGPRSSEIKENDMLEDEYKITGIENGRRCCRLFLERLKK